MGGDPSAPVAPPSVGESCPSLQVLCVLLAPEPVAGPRYRVLQYLPVLERHGLACDTMAVLSPATAVRSVAGAGASPFVRVWHWARVLVETQWGCLRMVLRASRYDRVLMYRVALPGWAAWLLSSRRRDLVYDFDDALDAAEGSGVIEGIRRRLLARSLTRAVRLCAAVSTSNARNAAVIAGLGGNAVVVPTSVDDSRFPQRHARSGPVVLGWIGTPSTASYLPVLDDILAEVLAQRPGTIVRLVGSGRNPFSRIVPEVMPWREHEEIDQLMRFDIGLMPMPDTPWTRGKAALKALQYGAAGIPTVASWTATNEEILAAGSGALLCRTATHWTQALLQLIDDAQQRQAMGQAARAHVALHYSVRANGPKLAAVLRSPTVRQR